MQSTRGAHKGAGEAEVKPKLNPEARDYLNDITGGSVQRCEQLTRDLGNYARTMNNEFKPDTERAAAAQNYKGTLEKLKTEIANIASFKGNFLLYFGGQEKDFDRYAASLKDDLWGKTQDLIGNGALKGSLSIPLPANVSQENLRELQGKYPGYRFQINPESMEGDTLSLTIIQRRQIDISANFEGNVLEKVTSKRAPRKIDEQFE